MADAYDEADGLDPVPTRWRFIEPERPPFRLWKRAPLPDDPARPESSGGAAPDDSDAAGDGADHAGRSDPAPGGRRKRRWRVPLVAGVGANLRDQRARIVTVLLLGATLGAALFGVYWAFLTASLPTQTDIEEARFARASVLYTRYTGDKREQEITRYSDENRTWVGLDSISPYVVSALVATEDHRYFRHSGIDVQRLGSSVVKTLTGDPQGGSTVTMQFARNAFPDLADDFTLTRKLKEWVISYALEGVHGKKEILEMYLNTVPFLYNAFGIEAAARTYFGKDADELTADEAATLVGMLKGPSLFNPVPRDSVREDPNRIRHPLRLVQTERSRARRDVVLRQMVVNADVLAEYSREFSYLSRYEPVTSVVYDSLTALPTRLRFKPITLEDRIAPYFADAARKEFDAWAEGKAINPRTAGLRIYTTLDPAMQLAAEEALEAQSAALQRIADQQWGSYTRTETDSTGTRTISQDPIGTLLRRRPELVDQFIRQSEPYAVAVRAGIGETEALDSLRADESFADSLRVRMKAVEAGFIALEPSTRRVRAYVGGRAFGDKQFDHASQARRQPGSTFKPFVYAAAMETGRWTPTSSIRDSYTCREATGDWWRPTSSGSNGGTFQLREALKFSKNAAAVNLLMSLGGKNVRDCSSVEGPKKAAGVARRAGLRVPSSCEVPSLALGVCEETLLDMVNAYATFADAGRRRAPHFIERIEDADGKVVADFRADAPRSAIHPRAAYYVLEMMRGVVGGGTGVAINGYTGGRFDIAGKTGTTQNGADGWFMLLHPNLVMGAWVGFDTPTISWKSDYYQQGSHTALPIVGGFFRRVRASGSRNVLDPKATFAEPTGPEISPEKEAPVSAAQPTAPTRRRRAPVENTRTNDAPVDAPPADEGSRMIDITPMRPAPPTNAPPAEPTGPPAGGGTPAPPSGGGAPAPRPAGGNGGGTPAPRPAPTGGGTGGNGGGTR